MFRTILIFLTIFFITFSSKGQISPKNNDTINYINVLISFPYAPNAIKYEIEISESKDFKSKKQILTEANAAVVNFLSFGTKYYWRFKTFSSNDQKVKTSDIYSFFIANSPYVDSDKYRYAGKKTDREKTSPGILFMDYGRVAVNRAGKPVWFLPNYPFLQEHEIVRDFKFTKDGTITALLDSVACEIDLDGNILWQAPQIGSFNHEPNENFHHDLQKLSNGNYMVLGLDHTRIKLPNSLDFIDAEFGTILEYNSEGNIVWSWNSKDYFTQDDLFSRTRANGSFDTRTHMNAFSTDGNLIYAGFRDISRIVVIDKATKTVKYSYGERAKVVEKHGAFDFFRRQHDGTVLMDGMIAVINNDSVMDPKIVSSLVIFSPFNESSRSEPEKIFEFKFDFDSLTNGKSVKMGNLQELDNGNILINMGAINRCIEITRQGEVVWSMFMEKYDDNQSKWSNFPNYRVNYTSTLYPYVFRQKIINSSIEGKQVTIELKIFNVGEKVDSYTYEVWGESGKINIDNSNQISKIDPNGSAIMKITLPYEKGLKIKTFSTNSASIEETILN